MTLDEKLEATMIEFLIGPMGCDTELICRLCHRIKQLSALNGFRPVRGCLLKALCNHCSQARRHQTGTDNIDPEPILEASMLLLDLVD